MRLRVASTAIIVGDEHYLNGSISEDVSKVRSDSVRSAPYAAAADRISVFLPWDMTDNTAEKRIVKTAMTPILACVSCKAFRTSIGSNGRAEERLITAMNVIR